MYSINEIRTDPVNQHRAKTSNDQVRAHRFAVSASHTQQGNVTALAQTHTHTHRAHLTQRMIKTRSLYFLISAELRCRQRGRDVV